MHETSLIRDLMKKIQKVATINQAEKVKSIKVRLGALSHFSKEHFEEHFLIESKGSIAEGAQLHITLDTDEYAPTAQDVLLEEVEIHESI